MQESSKNTPLTTAIGEGRFDDAARIMREAFGLSGDEFILSEALCRHFVGEIAVQVTTGYLFNNLDIVVEAVATELGHGTAVQALQDHINRLKGVFPAKQQVMLNGRQDQEGYKG